MKINHYICSLLFLFLFTQSVKASHVVGGTLTYKHNGGSNYTVTLKLFRDCGPGTWTFPNNVTISVRGNNGQEFSPSKDISMPLGTVTLIPSTLSPCAIPPNPIPCVQEGIYTATVNNLPAIEGGYHLYWQVEARNVSISNVNTTCNCIGASFYAYIPGPWYEDFSLADNTNTDNATSAWSITNGSPAPTSAEVDNNRFRIEGANNAKITWQSQLISIASCSNVNLSVDLEESGTLETNDSILVYYRLNGGPLTLFPSNGLLKDDFGTSTASVSGLNGNTVQIQIRARFNSTSSSSEIYYFDNVRVSCNTPNSNPTFNLFPPIFICAGQPFTFDHSATDIDGDSLAYSFYSPYNGDDNTGALDPTFQGNSAQFTPIVWKPGYSAGSPLGAPPLSLNPTTGLLTGTANTVGQYVVGVVVKEYRNGVLIGQTLRDFQFNVVNCPLPPPPTAGPDVTVNIGCTVQISAGGFNPATVVWNSVAPGTQGAYNNYLSCTAGCANPIVSQLPGAPSYIDFQVCGLTNSCAPTNACDVVRVFFKPALTVSISPVNPIICPGQTSTTLTASGTGGTPPYSFIWNNLNTSPSIVVGSGTYTVKMSDITGCPPVQATVNVTSNPITANAGPDKTVCKQSPTTTINGTVTSASGGIWTGGNGVFSPNNTTLSGATYTPSASELAAGFVNLTLTTTGNGNCPAVSDVVRINYVNFTGTVSTSSTQVSCFGGNDGTATVSITGGSSPYTYAWNTVPAKTTATASNLSIGTYTVTTTNSLGCTITNTVTVTQPTPIALNAAITDVSCSGGSDGSISITASGGTGPYTYVWQPGNQTTSSITGKTAGTYTVTVKDSKLCTTTLSYTINQPTPIVVNLSSNPVSCFNGSNGSASSTVSGGTTPYIYTWSSGATSPNASGLTAGTYTLTVKDNKGCTAVNTTSVSQPSAFTVSVATTPETCNTQNNGTAAANPSGGTPSYSYLWQPGSLTSASLTGLSAGTYTLTVTDAKGCTALSNPVITEPPPLTVSFISQSNVSCNGGNDGTVTANPAGGTPAYSYLWSPGNSTSAKVTSLSAGTYSVTVTDSKGCIAVNSVTITQPLPLTAATSSTNETCDYLNNGTTSVTASGGTSGYTYLWKPDLQTTATATGLKASSYTVTVTDAKGCTTTAIANVAQPAPILLSSGSQNDVSCYGGNDGMASMNVNGGTPSYTYLWSPGNSTSANANNLAAGKYSITVTDANGCNATAAVQINEPPPIITDVSFSGGTCNGAVNGNVWSSATGGTPGYNYLWQPGAYTTANVTNLSVGTYSLTLTDTKGCMSTTTVQIGEPLPLMVNFVSQKNISCFGGSDGSVAVNTSGGTPNYTYSWMPGGATTNGLSNLSAGTYSVTVTDANGCTTTNSVTITQPVQLTATASGTNETCDYLNNGTANVTVSGGTAGYTYLWKPEGQTSASITSLQAGTYTVTVTDTKGCSTTATTVIGQPTPLNVSFSSQNVSCFAGNDGTATAIPTGGTPGYAYLWTPGGNTTATKSNLTAGTYSVTITDIEGCNTTSQVNITQPIPLAAGATKTNETCNYLNDGTATAVANGGTPGYTYLWTPGGNTNVTISSLASGTYSVTITDAKGCTAIASTVVGEP
ncbi:MAG: SprB repeat-containing protein, partial [Bacteroidia bacterium]